MREPCFEEFAETLGESEFFKASRFGRFLVVRLRSDHRVLSTSACTGGERLNVHYLVNHQSCEACGDVVRQESISRLGLDAYHQQVCADLGIDYAKTALMGTAASMACAAHRTLEFEELRADAFVTAGVKGNAARAGDPASWSETEKGWQEVPALGGTINVILLLNFALTRSAHTRAAVTMTEAKSAALSDLAVPSLYSSGIATGTGTDQFCLASPVGTGVPPRDSTSPHTKAGEIIGRAVRDAVGEALCWQNGLDPSATCGFFHALGRFGLTRERVMDSLAALLGESEFALLEQNHKAVFCDPSVGAEAHAVAAVLDRAAAGGLPRPAVAEALRLHGACLACAVAAKVQDWPNFYSVLGHGREDPIDLIARALAAGWAAKWA